MAESTDEEDVRMLLLDISSSIYNVINDQLTLFDMGFFEPSVMGGGGGKRAPIITLPLLLL